MRGNMMRLFTANKKKKSKNFLMENSKLLIKELIKSFDGKRNPILIFTAKELAEATSNDPGLVIYKERFYNLYKGNYGASHSRAILVKKSRDKKHTTIQELNQVMNEVVVMSQMNHKNMVKLLGCCLETEVPILVFEYVDPNATLHDRILGHHDGRRPLTWESRLRIATEIAYAITYLHTFASRPIIHRDIKLTNIILDEQDVARLFDFSLSLLIPMGQTHVEEPVVGTIGYVDPEYMTKGEISEKADVFGFGIVLLEILTGQRNSDLCPERFFPERFFQEGALDLALCVESLLTQEDGLLLLHRIVDPRLKEEGGREEVISDEQLQAYATLAVRCANPKEDERPDMIQVTKELRSMWKTVQSS